MCAQCRAHWTPVPPWRGERAERITRNITSERPQMRPLTRGPRRTLGELDRRSRIVHVDYATRERSVKDSGLAYARVISERALAVVPAALT